MDNWVSRENQNAIRAIAAVGIMYTHLCMTITNPNNFLWFKYIGYLCVGVFYFYTGYNLMASVSKKWINRFLINKCKRIYIPFIGANIIFILVQIITGDYKADLPMTLKYIFGLELVNSTLWYVVSIIVFQLIFYILVSIVQLVRVNKIQEYMKCKMGILLFVVISWIIYAKIYPFVAAKVGAICYENERFPLCILVGAIFYCIESTIIDFTKKHKFELMSILMFLLCAFHGNNMQGIELTFWRFNLYDFVSPVICALLLNTAICGEKYEGRLLKFIGNISYEIYLLHMAVLLLFRSRLLYLHNDYFYICVYTLVLIGISCVFKKMIDIVCCNSKTSPGMYKKL